VNIKITEDADGRWDLWVTRQDGANEKPIYAAWNRSAEQIEALLPGILAEVPKAMIKTPPKVRASPDAVAKSAALYNMLIVLDNWIEGAQSNHEASDHWGENRGEECWRQFAPEDIRNMVNDAARELGISEFPAPGVAREDRT